MDSPPFKEYLKLEMLYRNGISNCVFNVLGSILVLFTREVSIVDPLVLLWFGGTLLLLGVRIQISRKALRNNTAVLSRLFVINAIGIALVFSAAAWLPSTHETGDSVMFVLAFVIAALATSIAYHAVRSIVLSVNAIIYGTLMIYYLFRCEQPIGSEKGIYWPVVLLCPILFAFGVGVAKRFEKLVNRWIGMISKLEESNLQVSRQSKELKRLAEENELAAQKAEMASKAKSVFLANVSHEIRTPLNSVIGFSQILESDLKLAEDHRLTVRRINSSGTHLLRLINDVLDMSKIEENQLELDIQDIDLKATFEETILMVTSNAEEKKIEVKLALDQQVPRWVKADPLKLRQILMNLLSNAIKFTPKGSVKLEVQLQKDGSVQIGVRDTGRGISNELQKRLFRPFEQCLRSDSAEGTGLGLSISRGLVELMGGSLAVDSAEGKGSFFYFQLSFETASAQVKSTIPPQNNEVSVVRESVPAEMTLPKVMIVDDIESNRILLQTVLRSMDVKILSAEDGKQAVELWKEDHPELILMDKRMPRMDGFEAAKIIKTDCESQGLTPPQILMVTADALVDHTGKVAEEIFIDGFIPKPFDIREVKQMVSESLRQATAAKFEEEVVLAS